MIQVLMNQIRRSVAIYTHVMNALFYTKNRSLHIVNIIIINYNCVK